MPRAVKLEIPGVWERIQEAFNQRSATEIAAVLGISKQSVYRWRAGEAPWLGTLIHISQSTSTSLHWLILGKGSKVPSSRAEEGESDFRSTPRTIDELIDQKIKERTGELEARLQRLQDELAEIRERDMVGVGEPGRR